MSDSLWPRGLQHTRLLCPSLSISQSLLKFLSTESVTLSNHIIQFTFIHGPNFPGSCAIMFFIASDCHHQTHPQLRSFPLWPSHFILSGVIRNCPLLFPSSILDTFWPGGAHLLLSYLLDFSYRAWGSCSKNTGVVAIASPSGPCFVRTLHYDPSILSGPAQCVAHSFIELHKPLLHHKDLIQRGNHRLPTPQEPAKKTAWWYDLHFLFT